MPSRELRKSDLVPFEPRRLFHVNSMGEFSIKSLDNLAKNPWEDVKEEELYPEEKELLDRSKSFIENFGSAEFRVYSGINKEDGIWMTLENEFRLLKNDASGKVAIDKYAEKFGGKVNEEIGWNPWKETHNTFYTEIPIYTRTIGDTKALKEQMLAELRSNKDLLGLIVQVL